ncbi:unnamed protein product [Moneuplotes crassus]|uniref:Major facilitator superfamily (MFS) profile domain-containing protein n=1 Tax=Euplotes crassus TaxID=5936 RepID=A0AAD1UH13_EUPCR|nr:unnamed protein product [Moneuplotes crassus]
MNKKAFATLIASNIMVSTTYMIFVPFIPIEFANFEISAPTLGYIYATYSLVSMVFSFCVIALMRWFGRKRVLLYGITMFIMCMITFAICGNLKSKTTLICFLFGIRILQGVAACMVSTSTYAIITVSFASQKMTYLGYGESAKGAGSAFGPVLGSILYTLVGFQGTFLIMAGMFICMLFLLFWFIPNSIDANDSEENEGQILVAHDQESITPSPEFSYIKLFIQPLFFLTSICAFWCFFNCCYYETVLTVRLAEFNLSKFGIGFIFSIHPVAYVIMSIFSSFFIENYDPKRLIVFGMFFCGSSLFLMGPSTFLPNSLVLLATGHLIMGATEVLFMLPILPVLIEAGVAKYPNHKYLISDISSGVLNFYLTLGQGSAPIYGSYVTEYFGYRKCATSIGILMIGYSLSYYIACSILSKPRVEIFDELSSEEQLKKCKKI